MHISQHYQMEPTRASLCHWIKEILASGSGDRIKTSPLSLLSLDINASCQGGDMTLLLSSAGSRHLETHVGTQYLGARDSIHLLTSPWRQCPVLSISLHPGTDLWHQPRSRHNNWMLASDWSRQITWPEHWPLIGQMTRKRREWGLAKSGSG